MTCLNCGKQTNNPKFCGLSCSASYNNTKKPKRHKEKSTCKNCGEHFFATRRRKYCNKKCQQKNRHMQIKQFGKFDINGTPDSKTVRKYLRKEYGNYCVLCGQSADNWCGKPIVLIVDHIDGNARNWRVSNLRLVCPNCDSQLPTFKGRNKGKSTREYTITQK